MHTEIQLFHKGEAESYPPIYTISSPPQPSLHVARIWQAPIKFSVQGLQSVVIQSLPKRCCRAFGSRTLLRALLGVRRCREALAWGISGPFWPAVLDMSPFLPILALGHAWRSGAEPFWGSATLGSAVNVTPGLPLRTPRALGCVWAAVLPRAVLALLCATRPALQACCCAGPAAAVPCTFSPGRIWGWDVQSCPLPPRSNASLAGQK